MSSNAVYVGDAVAFFPDVPHGDWYRSYQSHGSVCLTFRADRVQQVDALDDKLKVGVWVGAEQLRQLRDLCEAAITAADKERCVRITGG